MAVTLESDIKLNGVTQGDLVRFLQNVRDIVNESRTVVNDIVDTLQGNYILSPPGLAAGSNADDIANIAFTYMIGGVVYNKAAITTGTAPGTDVIPQGTYGAVALDIGTNGTLDAVSAADNATGYASAVLAAAGLPAAAADHARVGWVTVSKSDGDFTFGTTELSDGAVTEVFTAGPMPFESISAAITEPVLTLNKG